MAQLFLCVPLQPGACDARAAHQVEGGKHGALETRQPGVCDARAARQLGGGEHGALEANQPGICDARAARQLEDDFGFSVFRFKNSKGPTPSKLTKGSLMRHATDIRGYPQT